MISEADKSIKDLAEYFVAQGLIGGNNFAAVYPNNTLPGKSEMWPESFIDISGNGPMMTKLSQFGILEFMIMVTTYVELLPDGSTNSARESFLIEKLDDLFKGGKIIVVGKNHYSVNKNNLVYSGKELISGYSNKVINVNVKIY